jgi:glycosyltransferase involved in cell wall biosynthesis
VTDAPGRAGVPPASLDDRLRLIDARWLGRGGPGRVTELLLTGLVECPPRGRWVLWGDVPPELRWPGTEVVPAAHDPHDWYGQRDGWTVPKAATAIWPHQFRPLRRTAATEVTVIYDVITLHRTRGLLRQAQRAYLRRVASLSSRVITISEYSASTISNALGLDPSRLMVVLPIPDPESAARVRAAREARRTGSADDDPYALFIGRFAPHKNLHRLRAGFSESAFANEGRLILVGGTPEEVQAITGLTDGPPDRFEVLPACPQPRLEALLAGARLLVQPSIEEGFGLPVAEALAGGVPVASSDAGALPEAAAGRAELFDPYDVKAMAAAIDRAAASADPVPTAMLTPADFARSVLTVVDEAEQAAR